MTQVRFSRRKMLEQLSLCATAVLACRPAAAEAHADRLDVKDPEARALGYVLNAAEVDVKKFPSYVAGSNCENCLKLAGQAGSNYRPCSIFNGKLVAVSGWCSAWMAEM